MTIPLVIVGCGGFGREVLGIAYAINAADRRWRIEGFVDDRPTAFDLEAAELLGFPVLGAIDLLTQRTAPFDAVIAIGSASARMEIEARLGSSPVSYPALVHPAATVGLGVRLSPGAVVAPGARLSTNISIGRHVHVDQNATIGHDSQVGDFSRLNPQACLSGSVSLGSASLIGANATVLQGLTVGAGAVIGAGAVATRDVPAHTTVKGVPAR